MSSPDLSEIECWNCGSTQSIIYGGEADKGTEKCDDCDAVIAEKGLDSLTIPETESQATSIKERNNDFTFIERIKRLF